MSTKSSTTKFRLSIEDICLSVQRYVMLAEDNAAIEKRLEKGENIQYIFNTLQGLYFRLVDFSNHSVFNYFFSSRLSNGSKVSELE